MIIAVDAMGGDFAPEQIVQGVLRSLPDMPAEIALVGRPEQIRPYLPAREEDIPRLRIVSASDVVGMDEDVNSVLRNRSDSSLAIAVEMVRTGEAGALVSAGNSGAFMALAHTRLGTIAGLRRPAIAVLLPSLQRARVLIDGGANVDCQPVHLAQFGLMGSIYAQHALHIDQPRVGLLSIGQEPGKGNDLTQAAHRLLAQMPINFIGNIEGDDIFGNEVDVVVADGFAGNVALKVTEGAVQWAVSELRQQISRSVWARIGALLMRPALVTMRERLDYANYGGALLLGVEGICVVSHGRSDARALASGISVAYRAVQAEVVQRLRDACGRLMPVTSG